MEKSYATQIALQRLGARDSLKVVRAVLSPEQFSTPLTQVILERAEGNPLFLEDLAHAVLEQGSTSGEITVPETIQGVLMARMDRLPDACKRVLQMAVVCGRVVSRRLLRALWVGPDELEPSLRELQRLELWYESGGS
jgi:predicted ATPase